MKPQSKMIDWGQEYKHHTKLWDDQCEARWAAAMHCLELGHVLVLLKPLTKTYNSKGSLSSNTITTAGALLKHTAPGGKLRDCNYGIVTGCDRCTVLDFDRKNGKDGLSFYRDLAVREGFDDDTQPTSIIHTPSGGMHYYFAYDDRLRGNSPWADQGLDIQNSNGDIPTRHVVGPECVVWDGADGGVYKEDANYVMAPITQLRPVPPGFVDAVTATRVVPIKGKGKVPDFGHGGRGIAGEEQPDITEDQVDTMLDLIPCREMGYDDWMNVGRALHLWNPEVGFDFWDKWSATDQDRYDHKVCVRKWEGFTIRDGAPRVTMGTVIMLASKYGYRIPPPVKQFHILAYYDETFPLIAHSNKFLYMMGDGEITFKSAQELKLCRPSDWTVTRTGKPTHAADMYAAWDGRRVYEYIGFYPPGGPRCPPQDFNSWRGYAMDPVQNDAHTTRFLDLAHKMFPDEEPREWMLDWFADMVQRPGAKPATALVWRGPQGTGKDTMLGVFQQMFRKANTINSGNAEQIFGRFNGFLSRVVLCAIAEAAFAGNHKHVNMLKTYVTEKRFAVEDKFQSVRMADNCMHIVIMSNEDWAAAVDRDDRRYCVVDVPKVRDAGGSWWAETRELFMHDSQFAAAIMHFMMERKITNDLSITPKTDAMVRQQHVTHQRRQDSNSILCREVLLSLMRHGKALRQTGSVARRRSNERIDYDGWLISSEQVKTHYRRISEQRYTDSFVTSFIAWVNRQLKVHVQTGIRYSYEGTQRMCSCWPSMTLLSAAVADYTVVDEDEIERPDEWEEPTMDEWNGKF